jgi:hypothetical protein
MFVCEIFGIWPFKDMFIEALSGIGPPPGDIAGFEFPTGNAGMKLGLITGEL